MENPQTARQRIPSSTSNFPGSFAHQAQANNTSQPSTTTSVTSQQIPESQISQLKPSACAEFPGSFASHLRQEHHHQDQNQNQNLNQQHPTPLSTQDKIISYLRSDWTKIHIYKSAFIETIGTTSICFLSGTLHITITNSLTTTPAAVAPYVGVTNIVLLSLFIYALAPSSGGHVNPFITFTTMVTGLTGFSRGMLYMVGQTLGAVLAGGLIRGCFGGGGGDGSINKLIMTYGGGGCYLTPNAGISVGRVYLLESVLSFIQIFLSFGVGLDPRQAQVFGPKLGPFLVACTLGLVSFSSVNLAPGYPGASGNPARCFAFAVARGNFRNQWIWWVGPLTAAMVQAVVYHIAPPYHRQMREDATLSRMAETNTMDKPSPKGGRDEELA